MMDSTVVMLSAFNVEYDAVRQHMVDPRIRRHDKGTLFEVGILRGTNCRVALALTDKGNHHAAVLAERAIHQFSPVAVLFVGVAGALWDTTSLGDVVLATQVYAYHGGTSEDDGLKARPRVWEVAHEISQLGSYVARADDWMRDTPPDAGMPKVHFGPIAAGEVVQNSRISHEAQWIREHYNDALAIEMEAAGVAQAGHLNGCPVAIVRGISDWADGTKTTDADGTWQPRAAANAAAFAVRLAEELNKEREHIAMHEGESANAGGTVYNVASGQVGIQAAHVTGSTVWMGAAPPPATTADLGAELAVLRDLLKQKRASGTVDDATYEAARAELDIAGEALETNTAEGKSAFVLALKKLRGLFADVADLATKIATLLVAAKGLS